MSDKVTVKQTINKATSIYKIEQITVGKPGSEQYRHAFELADQLGLKHPDCIEHVFPTYADEQCNQVLIEEDFFSTEEPRQPGGCKLKTAPVRPVVAARPAEYVCSEDLFY
ncbi:hypothetical protein LVK59_27295 [Escherichia coli]|uniref:hypothetical protein n=1 Tax=Escherichia coli TaxID=562 RepID=UPI00263CE917|nr:hypothetical protein [Escherichia coli]MDN5157998.1 hypothetical protein [Escherichia coli]